VIFEAFTAVLLQDHAFYDVNPCLMVNFYDQEILLGLLDAEVEGFVVLQNVGRSLPADTA
jgi:hypothetical protein